MLVGLAMVKPLPSSRVRSPSLNDVVRSVSGILDEQPWLDGWQRRVLHRLAACGTGDAGHVQLQCDACRHARWEPMGCHDRHCPSCDFKRSVEWQDARAIEAIEAPYFHYVFTIPGKLYRLVRENQLELYGLFFEAVNDTIQDFARGPRFLGGTPSFFSMLHTTNRMLGFHPHVHCLIAGVALDEATGTLRKLDRPDFLFPARQLASGFRGRFLSGLKKLFQQGRLSLEAPANAPLQRSRVFYRLVDELFGVKWNIRTDRVEGNPIRVIRYLARYTHRTAISNARILRLQHGRVTYAVTGRGRRKTRRRTLPVLDFLKLFSRHILPKGFKRVRFYGLLAPTKRRKLLPQAQQLAARNPVLGPTAWVLRCALKQEVATPPACEACGAQAIKPVAIFKNGHHIELTPDARPIPPPRW